MTGTLNQKGVEAVMNLLNNRLFQVQDLRQEMRINPRLYQSMELLYMPLLELQKHLETELEENPFLELTESDTGEDGEKVSEDPMNQEQDDGDGSSDDLTWESFDEFNMPPERPNADMEVSEFWDRPSAETVDLASHLTGQLRLILESERDMRVGEEIIGNLNEEGMLSCDLKEIQVVLNSWLAEMRLVSQEEVAMLETDAERGEAKEELDVLFTPYSLREIEESLKIVQSLDPSGVGARDVRETVLIQLKQQGKSEGLAYNLVQNRFDSLLNHDWEGVARDRDIDVEMVQEAADEIAKLDPKPGLKYSVSPDTFIVPDLIVEEVEGAWLVFSNDTNLPRLQIASSYRGLLQKPGQLKGESKDFVTKKMNAAHWMIQAIEQRRKTMINVMTFLLEKQRGFFDKGVEYLKPLTLREVADHIEVHESTVSRVVNQKYVQTPRGVFSLKYFFSSGLRTAGGESISAKGVQNKIRNIVGGEDATAPLSDQKIKLMLEKDGVRIARRTVAKYRDQLGIPPTRVRKRV